MSKKTHALIKTISFALSSASCLSGLSTQGLASGTTIMNDSVLNLDLPIMMDATLNLTISGTGGGYTIFSKDNSSGITSTNNILVNKGSIEAACANAFGDGSLVLSNGTNLGFGSIQDGTTSPVTTAYEIDNPVVLDTSERVATILLYNNGYVVNSSSSDTPTSQAYQSVIYSGALQKNNTNKGYVTFSSSTDYPITLSGNSQTVTHPIDNVTVLSNSRLVLRSRTALPSTLESFTLDSGSVLEVAVDGMTLSATRLNVDSGTSTLTVDDTNVFTLNALLAANNENCVLAKNGSGTVIFAHQNISGSMGYAALSVDEGTVSIANITYLPTVTTLNGGAVEFTSTMTVSNPLTISKDSTLMVDDGTTVSYDTSLPQNNTNTLTILGKSPKGTGIFRFTDKTTNNTATTTTNLYIGNQNSVGPVFSVNKAKHFPHATITLAQSTLQITDDVTIGTDQAVQPTLTLASDSTIEVTGSYKFLIQTGSIGGNHTINKTGTGTLAFNDTSTANGQSLQISRGTVSFNDVGQLPGNSNNISILLNGGTLEYDGTKQQTLATPLTLMANSSLFNNSGAPLEINQRITGKHNLDVTCSGEGSYILSNNYNNESSTNLVISSGLVQISGEQNLPNKTVTLNGGILGIANTLELTQALTISQDSYIQVAPNATLTLDQPLPNSGKNLTLVGEGTLTFKDADNSSSTTTLTLGMGTPLSIPTFAVSTAHDFPPNVNFNKSILHVTDSIETSNTLNMVLQYDNEINVDDSKSLTLNTEITSEGGSLVLSKTGDGELVFTVQALSENQTLQITAGVVSCSNGIQLPGKPSHTAIQMNGGTLKANSDILVDQPLTMDASSTLDANTHQVTLSPNSGFSGANQLTVSNGTLDFHSRFPSDKTSTTPLYANNATVNISNSGQLPNEGSLTLDGSTLQLDTNAITYTQEVAIANNPSAINANKNLTLSGALTGSADLTLGGTASVILEGNSTGFSGAFLLNKGTLEFAASSVGESKVKLADQTTLNFNVSSNPTFATPLDVTGTPILNVKQSATLSGLLTLSGEREKRALHINAQDQTLTLSNASQYETACPIVMVAGTLAVGSANNLPPSLVTFYPGAVFVPTADMRINNTIIHFAQS